MRSILNNKIWRYGIYQDVGASFTKHHTTPPVATQASLSSKHDGTMKPNLTQYLLLPLGCQGSPPCLVAAALHMAFHKYLPQRRITYLDHVPILWTVWQRPPHAAGARDVARSRSANSRSPQPPISAGKFLVPQSTRSALGGAESFFFLSPVKTPGSNVVLETHPQLISASSAGYNPGGSKGVHATSDPVRLNNE